MQQLPVNPIIILDFGSQTTQLIATRLRSLGYYAQIVSFNISFKELKEMNPAGIILSGGPESVYEKNSPKPDYGFFDLGVPILGICYGLQIVTDHFGGKIKKGSSGKEYGEVALKIEPSQKSPLLQGLKEESICWMSHGDEMGESPKGFKILASTPKSKFAILSNEEKKIYVVQFHPEVTHTEIGSGFLGNFARNICELEKNWEIKDVIAQLVEETKTFVGDRQVLHAISGGVDSTVMAAVLHQALGDQLKCVMVDTGLLRKGEVETVEERFKKYLETPVEIIDAKEKFLTALKGVNDGQERRRIIGRLYIEIFNSRLGADDILAQGTLYPDVIESAACTNSPAHTIKTHHNRAKEVLELMEQGRVLEIFKELFKDEVRSIGASLGLPEEIVQRQPFPGPGLAIRILGSITPKKLNILKEADAIVIEELKKADLYYKISQTVVALDSHQVTCVKGDARGKGYPIFIKNVETRDFMTVSPYELPVEVRRRITSRILNEVKAAGRVLFDESTKPPATICYL